MKNSKITVDMVGSDVQMENASSIFLNPHDFGNQFTGDLDDDSWRFDFKYLNVTLMNFGNYGTSIKPHKGKHRINISVKTHGDFNKMLHMLKKSSNKDVEKTISAGDMEFSNLFIEFYYPKTKKIILSADVDEQAMIDALNERTFDNPVG